MILGKGTNLGYHFCMENKQLDCVNTNTYLSCFLNNQCGTRLDKSKVE